MFLFGLTAMSNVEKNEELNTKTAELDPPSCSTMFTICDHAAPDSFADFDECMTRNGCG